MAAHTSATSVASKDDLAVTASTNCSSAFMLAGLPRDLVEATLTKYCDGCTLYQFWLAILGAKSQASFWSNNDDNNISLLDDVQGMLKRALKCRRKQQVDSRRKKRHFAESFLEIEACIGVSNMRRELLNWCEHPRLPRQLFYTLDYTEQVPLNLVWSGSFRFRDPRALRPFDATSSLIEEDVQVMVFMSQECNTPSYARQWNLGLQNTGGNFHSGDGDDTNDADDADATTSIVLQNYNFYPVGSGARIVGVTKGDRGKLRRISQRMSQDDLVGTLERSHRNRGRNEINFVPRIISFSQARRRLDRLALRRLEFRETIKTMKAYPPFETLKNDWDSLRETIGEGEDLHLNSDECSLHCSWVVEEDFAAARDIIQPQEEAALLKNYRRYRKLFLSSSSSSSDDDAIGSSW